MSFGFRRLAEALSTIKTVEKTDPIIEYLEHFFSFREACKNVVSFKVLLSTEDPRIIICS